MRARSSIILPAWDISMKPKQIPISVQMNTCPSCSSFPYSRAFNRSRISSVDSSLVTLMKSSFFIVADRGNLKAYRAEKLPGERPPRMQLVQALTLTEAHLKPTDIFTDEAGAFPARTGGGARQAFQGNSTAERHYEVENNRRLVRQLAQHISAILRQENIEWWSFAAPSEIHDAVVEQLESGVRNHIAEHIASDLVNTPPTDLLDHFSAVRVS